MAKIADYRVFNFDGGVRRDKSLFELQKNELLDARNVEIFESGRLRVRRGSFQVGQTLTNNIIDSTVFRRIDETGGFPVTTDIIATDSATASIYQLIRTRLTANLTAGSSTSASVIGTGSFAAATSTIEIDGDLITYTAVPNSTTFTITASTVTSNHTAGASVNQWVALSGGSTIDGTLGVYFAVLDNILFINGRGGVWNQIDNDNGITMTSVTGEPAGLFITNYHDRLYVAGDGSTGTNGDTRRVSFSNRGSGATWTSSDFFDVEDQRGESIMGFQVLNDILWIFKTNSLFSYNETELKQRQFSVGAYNQKVIQEIDGLIYTFCPAGIFAGNGYEMKQIGEPVRQYWQNFQARHATVNGYRVVTNTCAGQWKGRYFLYIEDITDPDTTNDVVLEFDIRKKSWLVHTGSFTDIVHFASFNRFRWGDSGEEQVIPALFIGGSTRYYRLFENKYLDGQSTRVKQGGDVLPDLLSDTGTPVSAVVETPLYDLTYPEYWKMFRNAWIYVEQGRWQVSYRVYDDDGLGEYKALGEVSVKQRNLTFPKEARGYRVGFRFTTASTDVLPILNGFTIKNTEVLERK